MGIVRRKVAVLVLQRSGSAAASGLRLLSATRAFRVDCRVELIGVSLEEGEKLVLTSPASSSRRGATAGGASPILKKGW